MDSQCATYASSISIQKARTDVIEGMSEMVIEILKQFYQANGVKPQRLIIYRDGISDGKYYHVASKELQSIRRACYSLETSYNPKITFVAVQKRHHARFFPIRKEDADKSGNIIPGTIIEKTVTHPSEFGNSIFPHSRFLLGFTSWFARYFKTNILSCFA